MTTLGRVCAKIYSSSLVVPDERFISIFHRWIRKRAFGHVLLDVADYTHVPDGPGVVLVGHDTAFSLDTLDGRFGLSAQRRRPFTGEGVDGMVATLQSLLTVADALERDMRGAEVQLDRTRIRIEGNDRLQLPNTDEGFSTLRPVVAAAAQRLFTSHDITVERVANEPRERLAVDVLVHPQDQPRTPNALRHN